MIKAVIFDLDNTLYDYDASHKAAMETLRTYACGKYLLSAEVFHSTFHEAKQAVKAQLGNTGASHNRLLYMQTFLELIGKNPVDGAIELYDTYWNTLLENMQLYPYVLPLFDELKAKDIMIGMLTDLTAHIQHRKIRNMGLTGYIDVLVTSEEAGQEKPSKAAFDKLKSKLPVTPDEMLMVGDSPTKDIEGALHANMHALLFSADRAENMNQKVMEYIDDRMDKRKI